jgi:DNA polymerase-3 subunit epsilon
VTSNWHVQQARQSAIRWAQDVLAAKAVVIDFETTGTSNAEIIQIGIVDSSGTVLMDQLIKPRRPIPRAATAVHGITNEMVRDAPPFEDVALLFSAMIARRVAVAYNAEFEKQMIQGVCRSYGIAPVRPGRWDCAMEAYARFYGQWNARRRNFRWQKLIDACRQQQLKIADAHQAVGDAQMTLTLVRHMAAQT